MSEINPETPAAPAATPDGPAAEKKQPRARKTRGVIAWILVVLASLLIPIAVVSVWAIRTVTDTNQYVATMAPLARNEAIVNHLADKATDALFSTHVVQDKVTAALPAKAKPLVSPLVNQVHDYVHGVALKVLLPHMRSSCSCLAVSAEQGCSGSVRAASRRASRRTAMGRNSAKAMRSAS